MSDSLHVLLDVPPALADLEEDGRVAADDDDARHQEGQHHQELLRRAPVLPAKSDGNRTSKENAHRSVVQMYLTWKSSLDIHGVRVENHSFSVSYTVQQNI